MGIAYRVDEPRGVSVSAWSGEVSRDEVMAHVAALAETPEWGAGGRILSDLGGLSPHALPDPDEVSALADAFVAQLAGRAQPAKWAIVARGAFHRALQFGDEIGDAERRVLVFLDLESACIWLGVAVGRIRPVLDALRHEAPRQ